MMNTLIRHEISTAQFTVLWYIDEGVEPPECLVNKPSQLRALKTKGFLDDNGKLTTKANQLVKQINVYFKKRINKNDKILMGDDWGENVTAYNELFPKVKLPCGLNARSSEINVKPGIRWFFDNTDYTWEEVLKATQRYVEHHEMQGRTYMTSSKYFVRRQLRDKSWNSHLADWCQAVRDGLDDPIENPFKEKVF